MNMVLFFGQYPRRIPPLTRTVFHSIYQHITYEKNLSLTSDIVLSYAIKAVSVGQTYISPDQNLLFS